MEVTVSRYVPVPLLYPPKAGPPENDGKKKIQKKGNERKQTEDGVGPRKESPPSLSIGRLDTIRSRVKGSKGGGVNRE